MKQNILINFLSENMLKNIGGFSGTIKSLPILNVLEMCKIYMVLHFCIQ